MPADSPPPPAAPTGDVALPSPGSSAKAVSAWWTALDEERRERLIASPPPRLGNLNGVPAAVRDRVNRAVMDDDLARVENAGPVAEVLEDPERYGLSNAELLRYRNAVQTQLGLARHRGSDPGNPRPVLLWAYDPTVFVGQGRAAIAIGDPDEADNVAVVVPGAGSSVAGGWLSAGHDAATNLYDQSLIAEPDETTAVISWMGYDTPEGYTDRGIVAPVLARVGGERLAEDVNGLWVTHAGLPHVTVIGHSYGSTTAADAFAHSGMRANAAVLLGSPGTDLARSAADFGVDGGEVYVGAASTDPISWIGVAGSVPDFLNDVLGQPFGPDAGLGADPAGEGFGSVRFKAEATGADVLDFGDHSHYYNLGGEALRSMVYIVIGDGAALEREGLVAQGRRQPRVTTPSEVTLPWGGRVRLPRIDSRIPGTPAYIDPESARRRSMLEEAA